MKIKLNFYFNTTFRNARDGKGLKYSTAFAAAVNIYLLKVNNRDTGTICEMFKAKNKGTRMTSLGPFWCLYC